MNQISWIWMEYDLNQEPRGILNNGQSPQWPMKNLRWLNLGWIDLQVVSIQSCCEKRSQPIVVWAVWRPLQSRAQLLRWCCWKRRRRGLWDTVSTASISCPTFFSVFDWTRCTPNWHYFGWEGFQYILSPTNVALHSPTNLSN